MSPRESTLSLALKAFSEGLRPPPRQSVSDWISRHVVAPDGPRAGSPMDMRLTPYWVELLDGLGPDEPVNEDYVRKSAQLGFTAAIIGFEGYTACRGTGSVLHVLPTDGSAKDYAKEKLDPAIRSSKSLRRAIRKSRSGEERGSSATFKDFDGGWIGCIGANSAPDLSSKTVPILIGDEVDRWPAFLEGQGDPMEMAIARQMSFLKTGNWKRLLGGTPTVKGGSRIDTLFEAGDQRLYWTPCPHCETLLHLRWEDLKHDDAPPWNAHFVCEHCGGVIEEHHKFAMFQCEQLGGKAKWIPSQPGPGRPRSRHIDAIHSLLVSWSDIVAKFKAVGNDSAKLQGFENLWLGRSFEAPGEAPDHDKLLRRSQSSTYRRRLLPPGALFWTLGVDVQDKYLKYEMVAWGLGHTSWSIDCDIILGDFSQAETRAALRALEDLELEDWQGHRLKFVKAAVDMGGHHTPEVKEFCRRSGRWMAIKGHGDWGAPLVAAAKLTDATRDGKRLARSGGAWHPVNVNQLKAQLYGWLHLDGPLASGGYPQGYCHFPQGYDAAYFRELTAERLRTKMKKSGFTTRIWEKIGGNDTRNEALDCRVYATAAMIVHAGLWSHRQWEDEAARRQAPPLPQGQLDLLRAAAPNAKSTGVTLVDVMP